MQFQAKSIMDILEAVSQPLGRSDLITDVRFYANHIADAIQEGRPALLTLDAVGPNGLLTRSLREEARKYARYQISNLRIDFQASSNPFKVFGAYGVGFHEDPQYAIDPFKSRQRALTLSPNGKSMGVSIPVPGGWRYLVPDKQTRRTSSFGSVFFPSFCGVANGKVLQVDGQDTYPPIADNTKSTGRHGITVLVTYDIRFADPIHIMPMVTTVRAAKLALPTKELPASVTVGSHAGSRRTTVEMVVQVATTNVLTHTGSVAPNCVYRPSTNIADPGFYTAAFPRDSHAAAFVVSLGHYDTHAKLKAKLSTPIKFLELVHHKAGPDVRVHCDGVEHCFMLTPTQLYRATISFDGIISEKVGDDYYALSWEDVEPFTNFVKDLETYYLNVQESLSGANPEYYADKQHKTVQGDIKIQSPLPDGWGLSTHLQDVEMSLLDDNFYTLNIQ